MTSANRIGGNRDIEIIFRQLLFMFPKIYCNTALAPLRTSRGRSNGGHHMFLWKQEITPEFSPKRHLSWQTSSTANPQISMLVSERTN